MKVESRNELRYLIKTAAIGIVSALFLLSCIISVVGLISGNENANKILHLYNFLIFMPIYGIVLFLFISAYFYVAILMEDE